MARFDLSEKTGNYRAPTADRRTLCALFGAVWGSSDARRSWLGNAPDPDSNVGGTRASSAADPNRIAQHCLRPLGHWARRDLAGQITCKAWWPIAPRASRWAPAPKKIEPTAAQMRLAVGR